MGSLAIENWTPRQVSDWIKGLGTQFENCAGDFVDEEITGKALLTINAEYLNELSIENVTDQNTILEAVQCLHDVEKCLDGETLHGQVVIVSDQTRTLIEQLDNEGEKGVTETSESSVKIAGEIYQLAKKLLSWLIRLPFSEMNACWPLKDAVTRVVRDMTDESLLKNFGYLHENVKKLQVSFDNFLNEEDMHEVFKQPPVLKTEEITLEEEGLGIGITTSYNIHTVNSVAAESPAGKNKNIRNGDEIVKVNGQCVIAWQQKNVVSLLKSKPDTVSLTLKKLPHVNGPLNKPLDKPGTPLSEMEVIVDRARITTERTTRQEMKEAGIKEETSLEMQAIENEEEETKVGESIEEKPANETEGTKEPDETPSKENELVETVEKSKESVEEEKQEGGGEPKSEELPKTKVDDVKVEVDKTEQEKAPGSDAEPVKTEDDSVKTSEETETVLPEKSAAGETTDETSTVEEDKAISSSDAKVEPASSDTKVVEEKKVAEADVQEEKPVAVDNGPAAVVATTAEKDDEKNETVVEKGKEEKQNEIPGNEKEEKSEEVSSEAETPKKEAENGAEKTTPVVEGKTDESAEDSENGEAGTSPTPAVRIEQLKDSPEKKKKGADLPKMKIGNVKNVKVKGETAKEVEIFSANVVRREKKVNGAPNKRISCIQLGEADCEGWLTKKSGGHGLTPTRWRRQWCVLKEEHMYYYKTSFDQEAGGVFEITGYSVSAANDVKKPFAFKCEKEGAKKYSFHADNEVDREMWIKSLNAASRGEKRQKEVVGLEVPDAGIGDRKTSTSLKPSNRPRTASVLAGIRFNYYDEDMQENKGKPQETTASTAKRVNDGIEKEKDQNGAVVDGSTILKAAIPVEEKCEVVPLSEMQSKSEEKQNDGPEDTTAATSGSSGDDKEAASTTVASEGSEAVVNGEATAGLSAEAKDDSKTTKEGSDVEKDDFAEVAQSIKDANVNIDGTEKPSPESLLRKLSVNSKDEIMNKVIKLRLLKQSLKDKEQSMGILDELLSSDVTPETIAQWRTKYETIVSDTNSTQDNDVNENSAL